MRKTRSVQLVAARHLTLAVFCLVAPAFAWAQDEDGLQIHLDPESQTVATTEPLQLSVVFANRGRNPFYVKTPSGLGEETLNLFAKRGACRYNVSPVHFDRPIEALRFSYVPLSPGQELSTPIPPLNEPGSGLSLRVPGPGTYSLEATFRSDGPMAEGTVWPIWRGIAIAPRVNVTFVSPSNQEVSKWTQRLRDCSVSPKDCDVLAVAEFFSAQRVEGVAPLLRGLLRADLQANAVVASALLAQGEPSDGAFLRRLADGPGIDERSSAYFASLAKELERRRSDPCWP
jgi:hypothetical protein